MDPKELAMSLAIQYCATHQNEDLITVARKIFHFLLNDKEE